MSEVEQVAASAPRRGVVDLLRVGFLLLVLGAVGVALWTNWDAVRSDLGRLGAGSLAVATLLALTSPVLTVLGWRELLADLGSRLHIAPASGVFFVGQLGKYLPGSVWSVVVQTEMAARLGVPRRRTAVGGLLCIGLSALTGLVAGLPALPVLLTNGQVTLPWWSVLLVVAGLLPLLWPALLNRGIRVGLHLLRRPPLEHDLGAGAIGRSSAWFTGSWLIGGLSVWVLVRDLAPADVDPARLLLVGVCGYLLATGLGTFSIVVPAGVGVRDGILMLILATELSLSAAAAVVVVARFLTVLGDVVWAALGWWWGRSYDLLPEQLPGPGARPADPGVER